MKYRERPRVVVSLIPTGIRCSVGGYIGDATQATNLLASVCDYLVTNPNAVNAGAFNFKASNVLYVEGYAIDRLFAGHIELTLPRENRIGIVVEKIDDAVALGQLKKTIEAYETVAGIRIAGISFIDPLPKRLVRNAGQFGAEIDGVERLLAAAKGLIRKGAEAIAISTHIPANERDIRSYQKGHVPNPHGLIEAMLSHAVVDEFGLPAAHAPMVTKREMELYLFRSFGADRRAACENISTAYLGSVLLGLSHAPQFHRLGTGAIALRDVSSLVIPRHCARSLPVAEALARGIPVIEVRENETMFGILPPRLSKDGRVFKVSTYRGAALLIARLQEGAVDKKREDIYDRDNTS